MRKLKILPLLLLLLALFSCDPQISRENPVSGNADFSVYISLGNSLTAGFADNELYRSGQMVSYPNIIAKQMLHAGGGEFKQPLMFDEWGLGGRVILDSVTDADGNFLTFPTVAPQSPDPENFENIFDSNGPFHNLGVPGAKVADLVNDEFASENIYYARMASSDNATLIDDALAVNPTFFSLWIGNNDVLSYALSGGTEENITLPEDFETIYNNLVDQLTAQSPQGVIANIPDITSIPFFNTLPALSLFLTNDQQIENLNNLYTQQGLDHISFSSGFNGYVGEDPDAPGGMRNLTSNDLLLLTFPQDSVELAGWGTTQPLPDAYFLSEKEVEKINNSVDAYNNIIRETANNYNLAHADMNTMLKEAENGFIFDGINFDTSYINGGIFSLDAVHVTPRGNALIANRFIDAINDKYNSTLPHVSVTQFSGITFP